MGWFEVFHEVQQFDGIGNSVAAIPQGSCEVAKQDVAAAFAFEDGAPSDCLEQRSIRGGSCSIQQFEECCGNRSVETKAMNVTLECHFAQRHGMSPAVCCDELRASRANGELLNQRRPLPALNRFR